MQNYKIELKEVILLDELMIALGMVGTGTTMRARSKDYCSPR